MADRENLRRTFDASAALYHRARPDYPEELFDDLVRLAKLERGARLLEVGCGTGKATLPMVRRGFRVTCVELGVNLATEARARVGADVEFHVTPFERWAGEAGTFDLVYASTAWHWIDPSVGYSKAHELLRPSGHLAFWGAFHGFPSGFDSFFTEIQAVYEAIGEGWREQWPPLPPEQVPDNVQEIESSGLFGPVHVRRYSWEIPYTAEQYIDLLNTFSGHVAMDGDKRDYLYRQIRLRLAARSDQTLRRHWYAILHVAARRGGTRMTRPRPPRGRRRSGT